MKTIAYARLPGDKEREEFKVAVSDRIPETEFLFDSLSGQAGLNAMLRKAASPGVGQVVVKRFSDLGRDIVSAIRNATQIAVVFNTCLTIWRDGYTLQLWTSYKESDWRRLLQEMDDALSYYPGINRKIGLETARATGTAVGRPREFDYPTVQKACERLMMAKDGLLPSCKELAKDVGCSAGTAGAMLRRFKAEQEEKKFA
jgi:hypothetical protein